MTIRLTLANLATLTVFALCGTTLPAQSKAPDLRDILSNYADIALGGYEDALRAAEALDTAVDSLLAEPSDKTLDQARAAWRVARPPYQQTEVFRFGNPIVDAWEGRVNAWPLDEGLIDYVDVSYGSESDQNGLYAANVIANENLLVNGKSVDVSVLTSELIANVLHEAGGVEANVASGYHAIEFLLWGQDLNGTDAGAGTRSATDYSLTDCSHGNCERRRAYLQAAVDLLVTDLTEMVENWKPDGAARGALLHGAPSDGIAAMLSGMGSLSFGELAGQRMKLGLILHDPEEEHDCFSDDTHNSHFFDALGIQNVYLGRYVRIDGSIVEGPSLASLVAATDTGLDAEMQAGLEQTMARMGELVSRAENVEAYDQMIGEGNDAGNAVVQTAIDGLIAQTQTIERIVATLGLGQLAIEGSDNPQSPEAVFQ